MDPVALAADAGFPAVGAHVLGERSGRVVARLVTAGGESAVLKADRVPGSFRPEVAAIDRLSGAGIPVPRVLAHRPSPIDTLILSWTEGDPLSSRSPRSAQVETGRLLRRVHELPTGPQFAGQQFAGRPTVADWIADWLGRLLVWWPDADGASRLDRWHRTLQPVLADRPGCLMLFDARPEHFRVSGSRLAGLIDLHDLGAGDPAMDLAAIHLDDPSLTPAVLSGYGGDPDPLIPFFTVLRAVAAAEWHSRFGPSDRVAGLLARAAHDLRTAPGG